MLIISTLAGLRERLGAERQIVFVPTMGNLHEGHLNLMREARKHGSSVVASIFVNPLQFGPGEDFDRYPRTLDEDCAKLAGLADVVFAPSVNEMYPVNQTVYIEFPEIASELCGAARPGHFRGMATVVLKLFNIVQPQAALFGKKDYQQLYLVRQMVQQLNLPIQIVGCETARAADGLALSSRNQYLTDAERKEAPILYRTLQSVKQRLLDGERDFGQLQQQAAGILADRGWQMDYVEIRNRSDLKAAGSGHLVILAAARLGRTRLLDNVECDI
jgi:pantoate--beta-alanine ligase